MEYTVQQFARLAGISTRTIRYYDQIGLLKPAFINASGYRVYGREQVDRLQQILFYRALDFNLRQIGTILSACEYDRLTSLESHRLSLTRKRRQLDALIATLDKSISSMKGEYTMTDAEKFEGFKQDMVISNEEKYGEEIREKYGNESVNYANQKIKDMTEDEYADVSALEQSILEALKQVMVRSEGPGGPGAQKAAALHRRWLLFYWKEYTPEAHAALARMYVEDERFKAHYDRYSDGSATFLRDAIFIYTQRIKKEPEA